jgi:AMP nucleosidase
MNAVPGAVAQPEFRAFEPFTDAAAAVDRLIEIYDRNTAFLRKAFKEALAGREQHGRTRACYPAVRLTVPSHDIMDSRLSYGHVAEPGRYQTTITRPQLFRDYLIHQISLLLQNHGGDVEIGESDLPIPLHFAFFDGANVEGRHIENLKRPLRDLFDVPDLAVTDDAIVNGTWRNGDGGPRPLAPFTASRVDYSLLRMQHYTATDPAFSRTSCCSPITSSMWTSS